MEMIEVDRKDEVTIIEYCIKMKMWKMIKV